MGHPRLVPPESPAAAPFAFHEFFAGGGMVRAGLGPGWRCLFANDIDPAKAAAYRANFGDAELHLGDIASLRPEDLPGRPDLVWGSFPCQDLSLAGPGAGLDGARSGLFHRLWTLVAALAERGRSPPLVALENVCGALTAGGGAAFTTLCKAISDQGFRPGALVIDAELFVPQSRPRLFVVALRRDLDPRGLAGDAPEAPFHTPALVRAVAALPAALRSEWLWWRLPAPPPRRRALADLLDPEPPGAAWRSEEATARLLSLMAPLHRERVEAARRSGRRCVATVYRRTRAHPEGGPLQRAEVRFDAVAGCLRTPAGGSSRQTILEVEGERVRSRLLSPRETARLMGLPDSYVLPGAATASYHLTGDGVVVPVVEHLARHLFEPLLGVRRLHADAA